MIQQRRSKAAALYAVGVNVVIVVLLVWGIVRFTSLRREVSVNSTLTRFVFAQRDMLLDMVDEETGVRGYVASHDPKFLDIYKQARSRALADDVRVTRYSEAVPSAASELLRFDRLDRQLQGYFEQEIRLAQAGRFGVAVDALSYGKRQFDELRTTDRAIEVLARGDLSASFGRSLRISTTNIEVSYGLGAFVLLSFFAFALVMRGSARAHAHANEDPLTGIGNRRMAIHVLDRLLSKGCEPLGAIYIDLDGFKKVNDSHGHACGDAILVEVAKRLTQQVRSADFVARLGGDEFLCVLGAPLTAAPIGNIAQRIHEAVTRPYQVGTREVAVGCSIGWTFTPSAAVRSGELLSLIDRAMYAAKRSGGGVKYISADLLCTPA